MNFWKMLISVAIVCVLLGVSTAQAEPTVEVDDTGTNATAIRNLEFNGALYDVTFRDGSTIGIWGDEAFDFNQPNVAGDASVAVNDALNTEPAVVTVGPSSKNFYDIPFARDGIFVTVWNSGSGGGQWKANGIFPNTQVLDGSYAQFTQVTSIAPAPVPKTGQTESFLAGDDGELQMGVTWPDPRFTDNGDGTVTDNLTGLIWLRNPDCWPTISHDWSSALDASNNLADGQCGLTDGSIPGDWRLPNVRELLSLLDYSNIAPALPTGHPFERLGEAVLGYYWTSTALTNTGGVGVWIVHLWYGLVDATFASAKNPEVWPVRGGND